MLSERPLKLVRNWSFLKTVFCLFTGLSLFPGQLVFTNKESQSPAESVLLPLLDLMSDGVCEAEIELVDIYERVATLVILAGASTDVGTV